jgi:hypothetical protein
MRNKVINKRWLLTVKFEAFWVIGQEILIFYSKCGPLKSTIVSSRVGLPSKDSLDPRRLAILRKNLL